MSEPVPLDYARREPPRPGRLAARWHRWRFGPATSSEIAYDLLFAIVVPLICLWFDPCVFRRGGVNEHFVWQHLAAASYAAIGSQMTALMIWVVLQSRLKASAGFLGGVLLGGTLFAAVLGLSLLPLSIPALLVVIGVLGFAPFLTALVFLRHFVRACNRTLQTTRRTVALTLIGIGLLFSVGVPAITHVWAVRTMETAVAAIMGEDPAAKERAITRLESLQSILDMDRYLSSYATEKDARRCQHLANAYKAITGRVIDWDLNHLRD